jgi:hypothetical protein
MMLYVLIGAILPHGRQWRGMLSDVVQNRLQLAWMQASQTYDGGSNSRIWHAVALKLSDRAYCPRRVLVSS